jgi:hypothetical protein
VLSCSVKVLIQNCETYEFLGEDMKWTPAAACAKDFGGSSKAVAFMKEKNLGDVQVVVRLNGLRYAFTPHGAKES